MRRIAVAAAVAVAVLLAAWRLWPRRPLDDEAQIRQVVARVAEQAAQKNVSGIVEAVSERYRGDGGDKQELKRYLLGYLMRSEAVAAIPANVQLVEPIAGGKARVSFVVLLARTPAKKVEDLRQEELVGAHRIEADLEKEGGTDWRAVSATWRQAAPADWLR
jgi:hypothetical protein